MKRTHTHTQTLLLSNSVCVCYVCQECSMRANSGRFSLRDLLMVPMQRVLKYHLLLQVTHTHTNHCLLHLCHINLVLMTYGQQVRITVNWSVSIEISDCCCVFVCQELVKHTVDQQDKENLRNALDAMRVSVCVSHGKEIQCFKFCLQVMELLFKPFKTNVRTMFL